MQQKIISTPIDVTATPDPWTQWTRSSAGRYLIDWQQQQYDAAVSDVFGFHAVQLGFGEIRGLRTSRIASRNFTRIQGGDQPIPASTARPAALAENGFEWLPEAGAAQGAAAAAQGAPTGAPETGPPVWTSELIVESFEELPFAEQSIDLILMPHVLELAVDPHQTLREVNRVLRPDGRVVISGLNPVSLWGARQALGRPFGRHFVPGERRMIGPPRIKDWLRLLSFEVESVRYGCFRPPLESAAAFERSRFLEQAGDRWWPICGAVYLASAIKRVRAMRLVGAAWKRDPAKRHVAVVASPRFESPVPSPPPARSQWPENR